MLHAIWKGASLRSWVALGMTLAVVPLAASAIGGYVVLRHGVLDAFQDVIVRGKPLLSAWS